MIHNIFCKNPNSISHKAAIGNEAANAQMNSIAQTFPVNPEFEADFMFSTKQTTIEIKAKDSQEAPIKYRCATPFPSSAFR